jgi:hypothetical protein
MGLGHCHCKRHGLQPSLHVLLERVGLRDEEAVVGWSCPVGAGGWVGKDTAKQPNPLPPVTAQSCQVRVPQTKGRL